MTSEQFWNLTPIQFSALVKRQEAARKEDDYRASLLISSVIGMFGGKKALDENPPEKFFPRLRSKEYENKGIGSPESVFQRLMLAATGGKKDG